MAFSSQDFKSDQATRFETNDGQNFVDINEWSGRQRIVYWSFTVPAATVAVAETIGLVILPPKARVLAGRVVNSAAGGSATIDIGITGDLAKYADDLSVVAAGSTDFANTATLNELEETVATEEVFATVAGSALPAAMTLNGKMEYVLD